jgi:hypothetical protein
MTRQIIDPSFQNIGTLPNGFIGQARIFRVNISAGEQIGVVIHEIEVLLTEPPAAVIVIKAYAGGQVQGILWARGAGWVYDPRCNLRKRERFDYNGEIMVETLPADIVRMHE